MQKEELQKSSESQTKSSLTIVIRIGCFLSLLSQVILSSKTLLVDKELSVLALSLLFAVGFAIGYIICGKKSLALKPVLWSEFGLSFLTAIIAVVVLNVSLGNAIQNYFIGALCGLVSAAFPTLLIVVSKLPALESDSGD